MRLARVALAIASVLAATTAHAAPPSLSARGADGVVRSIDDARLEIVRSEPSVSVPVARDDGSLVFVVVGEAGAIPSTVDLASTGRSGALLDGLAGVRLDGAPCPAGTALHLSCAETAPIRGVTDVADRDHPAAQGRSILVELGGKVAIGGAGLPASVVRVAGPTAVVGSGDRLVADVRVRVLRVGAGGSPALGANASDAIARARDEVTWASAALAQCGLELSATTVEVIDPPAPSMLAFGCEAGARARGGEVRFVVDERPVSVTIPRDATPREAARVAIVALERLGFAPVASDNVHDALAPFPTSDVLVRRRDGRPATVRAPSGRADHDLSSDASLRVCLGRVDLENGLEHFSDVNAQTGSLEERALLKAFERKSAIEVFFVPTFASAQRVGESFMGEDLGPIRNVVIEDRTGVRASNGTSTLAHEIGHLLFAEAGHPDDFGRDTPTLLMDSDAVSPDAYGPRRVALEACVRAVAQHGPGSVAPLLRSIPR